MMCEVGFDYTFDENACEKCGAKCCSGESGFIFLSKEEKENLCKALNLEEKEFTQKFLRKVGLKYSLKELPFEGGYACIFLDTKSKKCQIYELRPKQCKTFPFWQYFKTHKKELKKECIGVCF